MNDYSQGGGFYTLGGYGWSNADNEPGTGWFGGGYGEHEPTSFDNFSVLNADCSDGKAGFNLYWEPSTWAQYYSYYRATKVSADDCQGACSEAHPPSSDYSEHQVLGSICTPNQCSLSDSDGIIENTGYCYCLRAFNDEGSTWSSDNPPEHPHPYWALSSFCAPQDIGVDGSICGYNKVAWKPSLNMTSTADGYNIYRSLTYAGCSGEAVKGSEGMAKNFSGPSPTCEIVAHGEALMTFNPNDPADLNSGLVGWWKMNEDKWENNQV